MATNSQINQATRAALVAEAYTGDQLNELLAAWLQDEGSVGNDLMSLWDSFFNINAIPSGQHNRRMKTWLRDEGFNGHTLADSELAYWRNRATTP